MDDPTAASLPQNAAASAQLLAASAAGDAPALESLLLRHLPDLRAFVRLRLDPLLRAHESGSDLVQSVCLEILAHPDRFTFRGEGEFRSWLFGAVLHKIAAHRDRYLASKRRAPGAQPIDHDAALAATYTTRFDPQQAAEQREMVGRLEQAFDQLSPEQREVLTLHRIVGLAHRDIAAQMGRSEAAARQLLHRALAQLAVAMRATG